MSVEREPLLVCTGLRLACTESERKKSAAPPRRENKVALTRFPFPWKGTPWWTVS